jgi:hypothetical protein
MNVREFQLIRHLKFSIRRGGIFRPGKEIKGVAQRRTYVRRTRNPED